MMTQDSIPMTHDYMKIISLIETYISSLDWPYIVTFIIICYGINQEKVKEGITRLTGTKSLTRYRVMIVGILYGVGVYLIRDYHLSQIENLFQSFVFALVFHKLIVDGIIYWLAKHGLPEQISKRLIDLGKLNKRKNESD